MSLQMRNECSGNSDVVDLDRVLRELQDWMLELDGSTRIGSFGIMTVDEKVRKPKMDSTTVVNEVGKNTDLVPASEASFSPSQIN